MALFKFKPRKLPKLKIFTTAHLKNARSRFPVLSYLLYRTSYVILLLLLLLLILVTPADLIYHSLKPTAERVRQVPAVIAFYALTFVTAVFLYSLRLWENRKSLLSVGKRDRGPETASQKADKKRAVVKLVRESRERSARIAYEGLPRDIQANIGGDATDPHVAATIPLWGLISHPGNDGTTRYEDVIRELPDLLEARVGNAVPPEVWADPFVRRALQRRPEMGLREYLAQLARFGVLDSTVPTTTLANGNGNIVVTPGGSVSKYFLTNGGAPREIEAEIDVEDATRVFLQGYERARFGPDLATEEEFMRLMKAAAVVHRAVEMDDDKVRMVVTRVLGDDTRSEASSL